MQLGMIGLGRMGANMVRRLEKGGHECVGFDIDAAAVDELVGEGMTGTTSVAEFVQQLDAPRHVWIMVPAAFVDSTIAALAPLLEPGDTIIDGGNSWYRDDIDRAKPLAADHGIDYVDVGTSGGTHGLERGYCLMVGGPPDAIERLAPIFDTLAPGVDVGRADARSTCASATPPSTAERGWLHCGPERRRPLRQDGPQRHRVRPHGRLRRGAQRAGQGRHRLRAPTPPTPRRRRSPTPSTTSTTSTWPPSPRCGGGARSWPAGCST